MGFSEDRARGQFGPLYVLVSENPYVLWEATEHWKGVCRKALGAEGAPVKVFTAPQIDYDRLLEIGTTVPMFETASIVVIAQLERVPEAKYETLSRTLKSFPSTARVLVTGEKVDMRKTFYKTLAGLGPVEVFPRIYPEQVSGWVRRIAADFDWALSPQAVDLLSTVHGTDLFGIRQSIERATLYIGRRRRIEVNDIETVLSGEGEHDVYQLIDAASRGDLATALGMARSLLVGGDKIVFWLSAMTSQCQRLLQLSEFGEISDAEAGKRLQTHPFLVSKLRPQLAGFGPSGLVRTLEAIFQTDCAMKTSLIQPALAWELLVWRIAHKRRSASIPLFELESFGMRE
jgi:DNA polymerase-3 subunit delta